MKKLTVKVKDKSVKVKEDKKEKKERKTKEIKVKDKDLSLTLTEEDISLIKILKDQFIESSSVIQLLEGRDFDLETVVYKTKPCLSVMVLHKAAQVQLKPKGASNRDCERVAVMRLNNAIIGQFEYFYQLEPIHRFLILKHF